MMKISNNISNFTSIDKKIKNSDLATLINKMIQIDPNQRSLAIDLLNDPVFDEIRNDGESFDEEVE